MSISRTSLLELERTAFRCLEELNKRKLVSVEDRLQTLAAIGNRIILRSFSTNFHMIQLCANAFVDASYIALGARSKLLHQHRDPSIVAEAIRRSKGSILALADLDDRAGNALKDYWKYLWPNQQYMPEETMELITIPDLAVAFTPSALSDIDGFRAPNVGCPVRGVVLNRFFDRYVETVIGE